MRIVTVVEDDVAVKIVVETKQVRDVDWVTVDCGGDDEWGYWYYTMTQ